LSAATALANQSRAFSILRSAQNRRATVTMTVGELFVFLRASTERVLRVGRGSDQTECE